MTLKPMRPVVSRATLLAALTCLLPLAPASAASDAAHTLEPDDFLKTQSVEGPACSADGLWAAYSVIKTDRQADELRTEIWMVNWAGTERVRLTAPSAGVSQPAFSPDGRYVSYLAQANADAKAQLTILDRRGGEPQPLTTGNGEIAEYQWSPDGQHIVLGIVPGADAPAAEGHSGVAAVAGPIVIDRLHFKQDRKGYLTAADRSQLFLLDVKSRALTPLTRDARFDDTGPVWSPDGRQIAFVSTRDSDPDRSGAQEIYRIDARAGASAQRVASFDAPNHQQLLWTADGRGIVFTVGQPVQRGVYSQDLLAVVAPADGRMRVLTSAFDRPVSHLVPGADAGSVGALAEDDGTQYPVSIRLADGAVTAALTGKRLVTDQCAAAGHSFVVAATDKTAPELHALEPGGLRPLSTHNDDFMANLALGAVEDLAFRGADGDEVHALLTLPVGYHPGTRVPTLLWIHGGPNGQDGHGLDFSGYPLALERQFFAAQGYAVLAVNYHGSSGRGAAFAASIAADWGNKEVRDLLAAADAAVQRGVADPKRLGIGGWSYGGILTDYTIAADARFHAAISGAGSANQLTMFGSDQYVTQYINEIGAPWKTGKRWQQISYPFFHADRISTPTLFMGGEKDFNVPIAGGEQMYTALRTLGVPAQLVIYPGQHHIFERPSYIKDRIGRFGAWFDRYLKPAGQ
jgi:dipeptidyl aminopeptidase/acylaminoacyl peptidase